eukprot:365682-Chlamydomonas_euryale.AAC.17
MPNARAHTHRGAEHGGCRHTSAAKRLYPSCSVCGRVCCFFAGERQDQLSGCWAALWPLQAGRRTGQGYQGVAVHTCPACWPNVANNALKHVLSSCSSC